MGAPITREVLTNAIEAAVVAAGKAPVGQQAARLKTLVLADPTIAKAIVRLPRRESEVLQGVAGIGAAQLLHLFGVTEALVVAAGWFGRSWNAEEVSTVMTSLVSLALAGWAWYGRETTSRPLA